MSVITEYEMKAARMVMRGVAKNGGELRFEDFDRLFSGEHSWVRSKIGPYFRARHRDLVIFTAVEAGFVEVLPDGYRLAPDFW
jgi:hypothetical protein